MKSLTPDQVQQAFVTADKEAEFKVENNCLFRRANQASQWENLGAIGDAAGTQRLVQDRAAKLAQQAQGPQDPQQAQDKPAQPAK